MVKILNSKPIEVDYKVKECFTLFETIRFSDGIFHNLDYHQERVNETYKLLFNSQPKISLKNILKYGKSGSTFRIKVIYDINGLIDILEYPYRKKEIKSIMLIENNMLNYSFKFLNREFFDYLYDNFNADEFLITQNGFIKEFTIGNTALYKSGKWSTPSEPLLLGTTLRRYLRENIVKKREIHYKDLRNYSKIALLNSMVGFNPL
jgi:4-amino-4-deoxychorismate lyase